MLASVATISSVSAGASDYYMGKGRIALSSDGNMHDNDDMHADAPMLKKSFHSKPEEPHTGWTWKKMVDAFGDRVNFNHISDQNGTGTGSEVYRTKDKFAAKTWKSWEWMAQHKDPK
ncbi:MAG: hypothetical protein SNG14_08340 [Rikenellaceae bacterium]